MNTKQMPLNQVEDESEVPQSWLDANAAAEDFRASKRRTAKAKRIVDAHWENLKPLHERCKKLGFFEKIHFAEYVAKKIMRGEKMSKNNHEGSGNWNKRIGKKIPIALPSTNEIPFDWLGQLKDLHKEHGRETAIAFLRESEKREKLPKGTLDIFLPMIGER